MPNQLLVLPLKEADAYSNMADDLLMLERHPNPQSLRFRHYQWSNPAYTFGYGQKRFQVADMLPGKEVELCRRPTGGGLVDHENDWTYGLALPSSNSLCRGYPIRLYRLLHEALADALRGMGQPAELAHPNGPKKGIEKSPPPTGRPDLAICFKESQKFDVVVPESGRKIAGAALKRNRYGLLAQGSIDKGAIRQGLDWNRFLEAVTEGLGSELKAVKISADPPAYDCKIERKTREYFASAEWNNRR